MSADNAHAHFAGDWLALREPLDHAARNSRLTAAAAERLHTSREKKPQTIVDLGSGSGSNLRYLAPRFPGPQHWRLLDHDPALLAAATRASASTRDAAGDPVDISADVVDLGQAGWHSQLDGAALVTASALFDLVTADWVRDLARACASREAPGLFVLSVDGDISLSPSDVDDNVVFALLRAHQTRDKSFGAALGVQAPSVIQVAFEDVGYTVESAYAPWHIEGSTDALAGIALVEGWRDAVIEQSPADADRINAWARRRIDALEAGGLRISVGHRDLFVAPR
ncbi:glycosyl transferase, group 1 [Salinisphaera dokdonensis CL-ES53]|uniref:Glycosyl transferase, group 1 n=1 Tax=Salinisphaera dokdonensis CL-ES53 TaxID=1304272 RepID=A0ABV2B3U2_9GAMM